MSKFLARGGGKIRKNTFRLSVQNIKSSYDRATFIRNKINFVIQKKKKGP